MSETSDKPRCTATTKSDVQCAAWALPDRPTCQVHDPDRQEHVRALRAKGGTVTALRARRRRLESVGALVKYGSVLLQDLQDGTIELDLGRGLFYALSVQAKLVELLQTADVIRRLEALEAVYATTTTTKRAPPWSA